MKISRSLSLFALLASLFAGTAGCGAGKTVTVDGQKVTKSEVEEGMKEVAIMAKNVKPGDPSGLDLTYQPKTVVGRKMKTMLAEAKDIHDETEKATAGIDAEAILSFQRLSSAQGRAKSRADVTALQAADEQAMKRMTDYFQKLTLFAEQLGARKSKMENMQAENDKVMKLAREMYGAFFAILDFTDREKPGFDAATNQLTFPKDAQADSFNKLLAEIGDKANAFEKEQTRVLARRGESFKESMKVLSGDNP